MQTGSGSLLCGLLVLGLTGCGGHDAVADDAGGSGGSPGSVPAGGGGGSTPAGGTGGSTPHPTDAAGCDPGFLGPFCETDAQGKNAIIGFDAGTATSSPSLAEVRQFNLDAVNALRARTCLPPLVADSCLDSIGTAANDAVATLGVHGYFIANCMNAAHGYGTQCQCDWAQENYGMASGSRRTWKDGVVVPLCGMMTEPKGQGHRGNIESAEWTRLGVGITVQSNGAAWCHEFGR